MIAVQPSEELGIPARVCIGPGEQEHVELAKQLLCERLRRAEQKQDAAGTADADEVTEELEAAEAAVAAAATASSKELAVPGAEALSEPTAIRDPPAGTAASVSEV